MTAAGVPISPSLCQLGGRTVSAGGTCGSEAQRGWFLTVALPRDCIDLGVPLSHGAVALPGSGECAQHRAERFISANCRRNNGVTNGTWRWPRLEEQLGIQQPALLGSDKGCVCVSKENKYLAQLLRGPKAEIVQESPGVKNTLSCQKAKQMRRTDGLGARRSPVGSGGCWSCRSSPGSSLAGDTALYLQGLF